MSLKKEQEDKQGAEWRSQIKPENIVRRTGRDVPVRKGVCGDELTRAVADAQGTEIGSK